MSKQSITDYVTKQIFIENNIVTYRSLSRHLGIHVNAAKNELATYHHNAPYHSQTCVATFLLSGTTKRNTRHDEDYVMNGTQGTRNDSDDGDEVPQTSFKIVNEKDLEDTKNTFEEIHSIHVYSLSPAPLLDAGLLCAPTEVVRNTDKAKGTEFVTKMGHIVGEGIKVGVGKKRIQPPAPVAGPSKSIETKPVVVKSEEKEKPKAAPEKPKATGKLNFFKQPEKSKDTKEVKKIKEEPAPETSKKMFFSKPATKTPVNEPTKPPTKAPTNEPTKPPSIKAPSSKAPSPAPSTSTANSGTEKPVRGVKRKSSVGLEARENSPGTRTNTAKVVDNSARRRKVVLSDDEEDDVPVKPAPRKKRLSYRTESAENSAAEGDAHLLMDIDDDQVEKVSRVPSTNASSNEFDEENVFNDNASSSAMEDVQMADDTKPKVVRKRKAKAVIPVGRNGLKKRKVTKTRRTKDEHGYIVKEDYSDWESVASGEEAEPPVVVKAKPKAKPRPVVVKKEEETPDLPAPAKVEKEAPPKKAPSKGSVPKPKAPTKAGGAKTQKGLMMNFFGPKKTT